MKKYLYTDITAVMYLLMYPVGVSATAPGTALGLHLGNGIKTLLRISFRSSHRSRNVEHQ